MGLLLFVQTFCKILLWEENPLPFLISHLRIGSLGITASSYDGSMGYDMIHTSVILIYQSINAFSKP